jgi:integrase
VLKRAGEAGAGELRSHDLGRTLISPLLAPEDAITLSKAVGHASVATTQRYDRRPEETRRRALGRVHVPYVPWRGSSATPSEDHEGEGD